jgi:hypothetical protein
MHKTKSSAGGKLFLTLFALPFAAVGAVMFYLAINSIIQSQRAAEWEVVPCTIISVDLETSTGSDSTTYKCVAEYTYEFNGRKMSSDRVSFSSGSDNIGSYQSDCSRSLRMSKKNNTAVCYVNPEDPSEVVLFRDVRRSMVAFKMLFALVFGGVGFGLIIFSVFGLNKRKDKKFKKDYPDKPWLWNHKWRDGTIHSSDKKGMIFAIFFALFWNLISFPAAIIAFSDGFLKKGGHGAFFVLLFPAVGIILLSWAVYAVMRYFKYGTTVLQLAEVPGVIGGKLAGVIHVKVNVIPEDGFNLHLKCIHKYTTGSGKSSHTHEDIIWEDSQLFASEILAADLSRSALPVLFAIPFDSRESDIDAGDDGIIWRLEAKAKTKGIDFKTKFEVPVFRTEESSPDFVLDDSAIEKYRMKVKPEDLMKKLQLIVEATPGGIRYRFPMARQKGAAFMMTLFCLIWTAIIVAMIKFSAPILFPVVFGLFDLFMIRGVLDLWFVSSSVEIAHRMITVTRGVFGIAPAKMIQRKNVEDIQAVSGYKSGEKEHFTIKLITDTGKKITLGHNIPGRKDAESVAERIKADILSV